MDDVMAFKFCSMSSNCMKSSNPHSGCYKLEVCNTLDTMCCDPSCNQGGVIVVNKRNDTPKK